MVLLFVSGWAWGASQPIIANETGLAYNNTYPVDISQAKSIGMQVVYTSATFANKTFTDGTASTGNLTVASFAFLSSATATARMTISSNTALQNQSVYIAGVNIPIRVSLVASSVTACNIASDISAATVFLSTCALGSATGVVITTAPTYGSAYNNFRMDSSSPTAISASQFSGGQDNQSFTLNGVTFRANSQWFPATSNAATATSIAAAINASASSQTVSAQAIGAVVTTTSTAVGTSTAYTITSSSPSRLTATSMTGGTNSGYSIVSEQFNIPSHGFTTALPVLYSGTPAIGGITTGTTYYVVVVDANNISLAASSALAIAGTPINLTSSSTQTTADTYTLAPLAISGTPAFKWQVSNDRTNWADYNVNTYNVLVGSITMNSYTNGGATTVWDPGPVDYNWLRLNVVGPTQGGILLKAYVSEK